jgi:hypothetical protein
MVLHRFDDTIARGIKKGGGEISIGVERSSPNLNEIVTPILFTAELFCPILWPTHKSEYANLTKHTNTTIYQKEILTMNNSYIELTDAELEFAQGGSGAGNSAFQVNSVNASNANVVIGGRGVSQSGSTVIAGNILTQNAQDNSTRTTTNQQWLNLLSFNH